jgi:hypothetical protein
MKPSRLGFRRLRNSCDICTLSKLKCSREKPVCQRCVDRGCQHDCNYSVARRPGRRRQTSVVSDDGRAYGPDSGIDASRMRRGTAPLTPSSTLVDSLPSAKERHDSTRTTLQQKDARDGGNECTVITSPEMASLESFTNIPMELPHDGNTVDFGPIDSLSLWGWGIDMDATNSHNPSSVPQMWGIPSDQDMLSGTETGANTTPKPDEPTKHMPERPKSFHLRNRLCRRSQLLRCSCFESYSRSFQGCGLQMLFPNQPAHLPS